METELTSHFVQGQTWLSHKNPPPVVLVLGLLSSSSNKGKSGPGSETRAYLGTSNDKPPTGLQVVDGVFIQVPGWHHGPDHLFLQGLAHFLQCYVLIVLHGDDDGVDTHRDDRAIVLHVLNCHLVARTRRRHCEDLP